MRACQPVRGEAVDPAEKGEVFLAGQVIVQGKALGHITDVLFDLGVFPDDVETSHLTLAAGGQEQPVEHADGGGFARPVGPQETENLPPVDLKADVVHRLKIPEMAGEIFDHDGLFPAAPSLLNPRSQVSSRFQHEPRVGRAHPTS